MNKKLLLIAAVVAGIATGAYARGGAAAGGGKGFGAAGTSRATSARTLGNTSAAQLSRNEFGGFGMTGTHLASTQAQPSSAKNGAMIGPVNDNGANGPNSVGATKTRATNMGTVPGNANAGASNAGTGSSKTGTMIGPVNDNDSSSSNGVGATKTRAVNMGTVPGNANAGAGKTQSSASPGGH